MRPLQHAGAASSSANASASLQAAAPRVKVAQGECQLLPGPLAIVAHNSSKQSPRHRCGLLKPQTGMFYEYPASELLPPSAPTSKPRPVLMVWRSHFWFNFYDFLIRVVRMVPHLEHAAKPLHFWLPPPIMPFYQTVLEAFGHTHVSMSTLQGQEYDAIWLCCIKDRTVTREGRTAFRRRTLNHLGVSTGSLARAADGRNAGTRRHVILVNRTGARKISTLDLLLAKCAADDAFVCSTIDFAEHTFERVAAKLQHVDALVGMHGADLANGYLLDARALLVEIFGQSFGGHPKSYGLAAYAQTNRTGLMHRRLWAPETDPACVSNAMARCSNYTWSSNLLEPPGQHTGRTINCLATKVWVRTIDCAVTLEWEALRSALVWPG